MSIILDAMGSDAYPDPEVNGAVAAARDFGEEIILVGNQDVVGPKLQALAPGSLPIRLVHAPEVLAMTDKPVAGARKKPENSMAIGLDLLRKGEGGAFVTAGNTGGAMVNALMTLRRIKGVQRPALTAIFPTKTGFCVVCDIGANAECRPEFLVQFAYMGALYANKMLGVSNPRVGLLSNGEEAGKGNELVKATQPLLQACKQAGTLNFIGNVEAKELFQGQVDVVITDGFTGNVLLKSSEAVSRLMSDALKQELSATLSTKLGYLLARSAFINLRKLMSPEEVGAVPLLGVDGLVFIGHGRSNDRAIYSAIKVAIQAVRMDLLNSLRSEIQLSLETMESAMSSTPSETVNHS
jgi:glycerol-3-phosphate acyltransferase PlsX